MLVSENNFSRSMEKAASASERVVDLETTGLKTWHGDRLCGIAIGANGSCFYFPFRHGGGGNLPIEKLPSVLDLCAQEGVTYIGHNYIRFDTQMLVNEDVNKLGGLVKDDRISKEDTIVDALLYNENERTFKLEKLAEKYVEPTAGTESQKLDALLKDKKLKKNEMWKLPAEDVAAYACADVRNTAGLRAFYRRELERWGLTALSKEMYRYARLLARMERRGLKIDVERCAQYMEETKQLQQRYLFEIQQAAGRALNPNSPKQLCEWLGVKSTAMEVLEKMQHPHAKLLEKYRQCVKANSTYYSKILALIDKEGVLHPQLNLTRDPSDVGGTRSGRLSCSHPNLQALPRPNDIYRVRDLVVARPGQKLGKFDYQRAEMWMGGSYCGDPAIYDAYHIGADLYQDMADELHITRGEAKILFLMIQYGAGAWKIAESFGWSESHAWAVRDRFHDSYPRIHKKMWALANDVEVTGCMRLFTGRLAHFDGKISKFYTAWNRLIQGSVGEMVRLAMQQLEPIYDHFGAEMLLQVHDEILAEFPTEHEAQILQLTRAIMEGFHQWDLQPRIDPKLGYDYGHMEGIE